MVLVVTIGGIVGVVAACCRPVFVRWMLATTADTAPLEEVVVDSKSDSGSATTFVCADEDSSGDSYFTIGGFPPKRPRRHNFGNSQHHCFLQREI